MILEPPAARDGARRPPAFFMARPAATAVTRWLAGRSDQGRGALLIAVLAIACLTVGVVTFVTLYRAAVAEQRARLLELATVQASLIDAIAPDTPAGRAGPEPERRLVAVAHGLRGAYGRFRHATATGEFVLGMGNGQRFSILMVSDPGRRAAPDALTMGGRLAEPMQLALAGRTGTLIGRDFRGERVLAAHVPILEGADARVRFGLVAKVALAEIRAPYLSSAGTSTGIALALVVGGALLFARVNRQVIARLRDSEGRVRTIVETAADAIVALDAKGRISSVNPAAEAMFLRPAPELLGQPAGCLIAGAVGPAATWPMRQRRSGRGARQRLMRGEMTGLRKGRRPFELELTVSTPAKCLNCAFYKAAQAQAAPGAATDADRAACPESCQCTILVARDVTRAKLAERHLVVQHHALQASNAELAAKRRELEGFYHTVSHELRTPLTAATEFANILGEGLLGELLPAQAEATRVIGDNCRQMAVMIADLVDASRLDSGKLALRPEPLSMAALVRHVVNALQPVAARAEVRLTATCGDGVPEVEADPVRVRQVLGNLLSNALKFTPRGGAISIDVAPAADGVEVRVADTGPGIPPDQQEAIFERFYQADDARDQAKGGLGLGLAISRGLVALHGGHISVHSRPGQGTTFAFTLPSRPHAAA